MKLKINLKNPKYCDGCPCLNDISPVPWASGWMCKKYPRSNLKEKYIMSFVLKIV